MSDIKVIIETILKNDQFKKAIKESSGATESATKKKTGLLGSISKLKAGYLLVAAVIGGVFVTAIKSAIVNAGKFEQTMIAFKTMLGGNEIAAKKLVNELEQIANKTPFMTNTVIDAGKKLLAFGINSNEVAGIIKMLGDVSAGTGKDLGEMSVIFGQIKTAGRLMGQDLLQLINAGFNPLQVISEKTGKSVADLKKEMEKGLITFKDVSDAFKTATSEGGKFYNLTEQQSKSFLGVTSTMASNISLISRNIGELLIPVIKPAIELLNKMAESILEMGQKKKDLKDLEDEIDLLKKGMINASKETSLMGEELDNIRNKAEKDILSGFKGSLSSLDKQTKKTEESLERVKESIKNLGETPSYFDLKFLKEMLSFKAKYEGELTALKIKRIELEKKAAAELIELEKKKLAAKGEVNELYNSSENLSDEEQLKRKIERLNELVNSNLLANDQIAKATEARINYENMIESIQQKERLSKVTKFFESASKAVSGISSLQQQASANRLQRIENEKTAISNQYDNDLKALDDQLDQKLISQEEYDKRKKAIDKKYENEKKALEKKEKAQKRKSFIAQKVADIAQAAINTALAITRAISTFPVPPFPHAIAAGALGAAQVAAISARPIPEFATGSEYIQKDMTANIHKGERILRADQNVPGVSNDDFYNAALRGLSAGSGQSLNTTNNTNTTENVDNRNIVINVSGVKDEIQFVNRLKQRYGLEVFK